MRILFIDPQITGTQPIRNELINIDLIQHAILVHIAIDAGEQVDFVYLRKILNLTDGNLGAHLAKLENTGYVKIEKTFIARTPRTFINATGKGRDAFEEHSAALKEIIRGPKK